MFTCVYYRFNNFIIHMDKEVQKSGARLKIVLVSVFYLLFAVGTNAFTTVVTKIWESTGDKTLSPMYFTIQSITAVITGTFTSKLNVSEKWQMVIFSIGFSLTCVAGFLMDGASKEIIYLLAVIGALINGVCLAFIFTCQGRYIHKICVKYQTIENKGQYFGIFSSLSNISTIFSGFVALFGLGFLSHSSYFLLVAGIALCSTAFCWFLVEDVRLPGEEKKPTFKEQLKKMCKFYPAMKFFVGYALI